ncbi:MAG: RnfABCDGE type electron transport complex subunit D [Acidobacteria bacterium]|nr:RnfABCDGE type electron transport complex subunit D [Acidobacteriota bacterium]
MSAARRRRPQPRRQRGTGQGAQTARRQAPPPSPLRLFWVPLALTLGLLLVSFVPRIQANVGLTRSLWAAVVGLLVWQVALFARLRGTAEDRSFHTILRPQHYLQASVQVAVFVYWGYFWRPVYDHAWLLVAQLLFAYVFDMLLSWSRRDNYVLGCGPFPIIFSTNLFLWFRDDWFYLQFLMLAAGFMGKEFVRWQRDGRSTHIFNPSAFSLGLFSLVLIATSTTDLTWGLDIATTLTLAPRIYLFLFLIGLVVMYCFSITLVAGSAAIVLFGASALYSAVTGVPYFIDSEIPSAVFLGLHLLVTDPSTSPRTPLGKTLFGVLYGLGVFVLYSVLSAIGVPTFYDKLLSVPLLNLSVQWIDRLVRSLQDSAVVTRWSPDWTPARANLVHMTVWILFFGTMTAIGATDGRHRGDTVPFWEQACGEHRLQACDRLIQIESNYCGDNAGWACNELGRHYTEGTIVTAAPERALGYFSRACEVRFQAGCVNLLDQEHLSRADPRVLDLRLLLREAGRNLLEMPEPEVYARACDHGWRFACDGRTP